MTTTTLPTPPSTASPAAVRLPPHGGRPRRRAQRRLAADQPGLIITAFGALKFLPGASPAEGLVMRTTEALTFALVGRTNGGRGDCRPRDRHRPVPANRPTAGVGDGAPGRVAGRHDRAGPTRRALAADYDLDPGRFAANQRRPQRSPASATSTAPWPAAWRGRAPGPSSTWAVAPGPWRTHSQPRDSARSWWTPPRTWHEPRSRRCAPTSARYRSATHRSRPRRASGCSTTSTTPARCCARPLACSSPAGGSSPAPPRATTTPSWRRSCRGGAHRARSTPRTPPRSSPTSSTRSRSSAGTHH